MVLFMRLLLLFIFLFYSASCFTPKAIQGRAMNKIYCSLVTLRALDSSLGSPHSAIWSARRLIRTTVCQLTLQHSQKPPPLKKHKLPPPPPLVRLNLKQPTAPLQGTTALPWRNLHETLSAFVEYVPTFYVPIQGVAAIMPEEIRTHFQGRGKLINFLRRYPFLFDLRNTESGSRIDVRLHKEVSHPRCGVADQKFVLTDIGAVENYVAKPEFIVSMDSIENSTKGVALQPQSAPPAIRVHLEERVPVLDRLVAFIPVNFEPIKKIEENLPDDILFHPYFDCQGGLASIASKFPDDFQVVDGKIRRRPPHLAPLALDDFTLKQSPIPEIASLIEREVCNTDIPRWVNITSLYEQLTLQQKREVKRGFKSFAGFLRAHGKSVSVSQDMLYVSMWIPPPSTPTDAARDRHLSATGGVDAAAQGDSQACMGEAGSPCTTSNESDSSDKNISGHQESLQRDGTSSDVSTSCPEVVQTTASNTFKLQVINELFDRFPAHRSLNLEEALQLLPESLQKRLPKNVLSWVSRYENYFLVENPEEKDPLKVRIQRVSDRQPLDIVRVLYNGILQLQQGGTKGCSVSVKELIDTLSSMDQQMVTRIGILNLVNMLTEWIALEPAAHMPSKMGCTLTEADIARGDCCLRQLRSLAELEAAIAIEQTRREKSCAYSIKDSEKNT